MSWVETAELPFLLDANPAFADKLWEGVRDRSFGRLGEGGPPLDVGGSIVAEESNVDGSEGCLVLSAMLLC